MNIERPTSNFEHPTQNLEHSTLNFELKKNLPGAYFFFFNFQSLMFDVGRSMFDVL